MASKGSLDPRRLLILRVVAAEGSISGGARKLGWTQPAVSQHLQALERSVGTPLLHRRSCGVSLTEAGRAVVVHADGIAAHLEAAQRELDDLVSLKVGAVRLAAFPSALATIVPDALARLATTTGIEVDLIEAEPPEAAAMVRRGDVDVALAFTYETSPQFPADLLVSELGVDPVAVVASRDHPVAAVDVPDLALLTDADWVAGCLRCREHLVIAARGAGFVPRIRHETDDYVVVQSIVVRGLAVAALPLTALRAYRHPDVVVKQVPDLTPRTVVTLRRPGIDRVPSVAAVLATLSMPSAGLRDPAPVDPATSSPSIVAGAASSGRPPSRPLGAASQERPVMGEC